MNKNIIEKLKHHQAIGYEDWNQFLVSAHHQSPAMTSKTFDSMLTTEGFNSYELLAKEVEHLSGSPIHVVDLGCGDGILFKYMLPKLHNNSSITGVDMSADELELAKKRIGQRSNNIEFHLTNADRLLVGDGAVDVVLSHLSFMLMRPIEKVLKELHRVIKPGGFFSAIVSSPEESGPTKDLFEIVQSSVDKVFPDYFKLKTSLPQPNQLQRLTEMFVQSNGFKGLSKFREFNVEKFYKAEEVFQYFKDLYMMNFLDSESLLECKKKLTDKAKSLADSTGRLKITAPLIHFTAIRNDSYWVSPKVQLGK